MIRYPNSEGISDPFDTNLASYEVGSALDEARSCLSWLKNWHDRQHGWVGSDDDWTLTNLLKSGQKAVSYGENVTNKAAQTAWSATERYAYDALQTANDELVGTLAVLQAAAEAMQQAAENQAQAYGDDFWKAVWEQTKATFKATWSMVSKAIWTAVPYVLLGGGLLLLLAGGLPGVLVGGAALLGGATMMGGNAIAAGPPATAYAASVAAWSI